MTTSLHMHSLSTPSFNLTPEELVDRLSPLPKELICKIIDFTIPKIAYLNHRNQDILGICYTSHALSLKTIEFSILKTRPKAVNEFIKKINGDIKKLDPVAKKMVKDLGESIFALDLSEIELTATILRTIATYFPHLQSLNLKNCKLNDNDLKQIIWFTKLEKLSLDGNKAITSTAIESLGQYAPKLLTLNLTSLYVTDKALNALARSLPRLQSLILSGCNDLTHECLTAVLCFTKLQELNFAHCRWINDDGFKLLTALKQLETLSLASCRDISDKTIQILPQFPHLKELDLSHCAQLTPAALDVIVTLDQLTKLLLLDCNDIWGYDTIQKLLNLQQLKQLVLPPMLLPGGFDRLTEFPQLTSLQTPQFQITEAHIQQLAKIGRLKELILTDLKIINNNSIKFLIPLQELEVLQIPAGSKITNIGLQQLALLPNLHELHLIKNCGIGVQELITLSQLSQLSIINLSYCPLLVDKGYTHLHYLAALPNLTKLLLHGWEALLRTDYSNYSFFNPLNSSLNNFDNALHESHLIEAVIALQKQLPSLKITLDEFYQFHQFKTTLQKTCDFISAIGIFLSSMLVAVIQFPNTFMDIINTHIYSTSDPTIRNFLNKCKIVYAAILSCVISASFASIPLIGTTIVAITAFLIWNTDVGGTNFVSESTMLGLFLIVGINCFPVIPITTLGLITLTVTMAFILIALSPTIVNTIIFTIPYEISYVLEELSTKIANISNAILG